MSKASQAARTSRALAATKPEAAPVKAELVVSVWSADLHEAAAGHTSAARRLLELVLAARTAGFDPDMVAEHVKDAFLAAGNAENTAKMRATEAKGIMKLPEEAVLAAGGGSVQTFASNARKIAKERGLVQGRERGPKTPTKAPVEGDPAAVAETRAAIAKLKAAAGDNATILSILGDMTDMLDEIAEELLSAK